MITEAQFTTAMERAVEKRGADWKYPSPENAPPGFYLNNMSTTPTYSDGYGNPTCLIGAALFELGWKLPGAERSPNAAALLLMEAPIHVVLAARSAQIHQDKRNTWGESLSVYRLALEYIQENKEGVPFYAEQAEVVYYHAVSKLKGVKVVGSMKATASSMSDIAGAFSAISVSANPYTFNEFATGGIVSGITGGTITGMSTFGGKGSVTFKMPASLTIPTITADYFVEEPLVKKDHALIA